MARYILPALLFFAFLVLPEPFALDDRGFNYPYDWSASRNWSAAYPTLRADIAQLDAETINQPLWTASGQPRRNRYLNSTTAAARADFTVAYWYFLDKTMRETYEPFWGGLNSYRQCEIPYADSIKFAHRWWTETSPNETKPFPGDLISKIDNEWLCQSLSDATALLYRAHLKGTKGFFVSSTPQPERQPPEHLPFLDAGFFIHQECMFERGHATANFLDECKERSIFAADAVVSLSARTADTIQRSFQPSPPNNDYIYQQTGSSSFSLNPQAIDKAIAMKTRYGFINMQGQFALPVSTILASSFAAHQSQVLMDVPGQLSNLERRYNVSPALAVNNFEAQPEIFRMPVVIDCSGICLDVAPTQPYYSNWSFVDLTSDPRPRRVRLIDGFFGYDLDGKMARRFDWAADFHEGRSLVLQNGKFGFIDQSCHFVVQPAFAEAGNFSQGLAPVKDCASGKWGFVDLEGHYVIAPRFAKAYPFVDGLAVRRALACKRSAALKASVRLAATCLLS